MKKAEIINVSMQVVGTYFVVYASGARRSYKMDKAPKTVRAWVSAHPELQERVEKIMEWDRKTTEISDLMMAVSGKGAGSGKPYEELVKKLGKHTAILVAEKAGMNTIGYVTKRMAVEYLLAA